MIFFINLNQILIINFKFILIKNLNIKIIDILIFIIFQLTLFLFQIFEYIIYLHITKWFVKIEFKFILKVKEFFI